MRAHLGAAANALRHGPRKGPLLVPEELAFEQARGHGSAVERHEGVLAPGAMVVDGARNEFLAGAGLAVDQHGRLGRCHDFHLL